MTWWVPLVAILGLIVVGVLVVIFAPLPRKERPMGQHSWPGDRDFEPEDPPVPDPDVDPAHEHRGSPVGSWRTEPPASDDEHAALIQARHKPGRDT